MRLRGAPVQFYFCPVCFAVRYTRFGFLVFYSRHCPGVFFSPPCAGLFMLWYLPVFMLLCLCICYCFCFVFAAFVGRFFFATFFVFAGFLYNLVLFPPFPLLGSLVGFSRAYMFWHFVFATARGFVCTITVLLFV